MNKSTRFMIVMSNLLALAMTTSNVGASNQLTQQAASAKSESVVWQCANDLEVSCFEGKCETTSEGFTPMSIRATYQQGHWAVLSVCAYSGCWEDKVNLYNQKPFVLLMGKNMPFSSAPNDDSLKEDIVLFIDESDGLGIIKAGTFAQPVLCKKSMSSPHTKAKISSPVNKKNR